MLTLEEGTIPDLSNLVVYKVFSDNSKERIYNFDYSKDVITLDTDKIIFF